MVIAIRFALDGLPLLRNIDFATDDRMDALGFRAVIELNSSEEVSMIGHGNRRHLLLGSQLHQLRNFTSSVQERVVRVAM